MHKLADNPADIVQIAYRAPAQLARDFTAALKAQDATASQILRAAMREYIKTQNNEVQK